MHCSKKRAQSLGRMQDRNHVLDCGLNSERINYAIPRPPQCIHCPPYCCDGWLRDIGDMPKKTSVFWARFTSRECGAVLRLHGRAWTSGEEKTVPERSPPRRPS